MERVVKLLGSSTECASSGSTRGSSGYEASRSSNGSIPQQTRSDSSKPEIIITVKESSGKITRKRFLLGEEQKAIEFFREKSPILRPEVSQISFGSFDIEKTTYSTPLHPERPETSDSDNLFASVTSEDYIRGAEVAGDDMDTLPPAPMDTDSQPQHATSSHGSPAPLYMTPEGLKRLELQQVSEDSEDDDTNTFSPVPSLPFSLSVGKGNIDDYDVAVECSPDVPHPPSPDMFKDIKFVLSCEVQKDTQIHVAGLRKDSYAKLIAQGGGVVYDTIPSDTRNTVLISEKPSHSETFLRALLLGIPCVKSKWIDYSIKYHYTSEQCRIPEIEWSMFLPRGLDIIKRRHIPQSKDHPRNPPKPFAGQIMYLQGSNDFKDTWSQLIENGGGNALKRWFRSVTSELTYPTVVVSEGHRKPSTTTMNFNVEIVRHTWLIQCIIMGEKVETRPFLLEL